MYTLLTRQILPLPFADLVLRDIVHLREQEKRDGDNIDDDQVPVTFPIKRLVIVAVDIG